MSAVTMEELVGTFLPCRTEGALEEDEEEEGDMTWTEEDTDFCLST